MKTKTTFIVEKWQYIAFRLSRKPAATIEGTFSEDLVEQNRSVHTSASESVGRYDRNLPGDTRTIQDALNRVRSESP